MLAFGFRVALLLSLLATTSAPASAQLSTLLEQCAAPGNQAGTTVNFCRRALDSERLAPDVEAQVRTNLGIGYFEQRQYPAAIAEFDKAIGLTPALADAFLYRARAHERLGRLTQAAADFRAVLRLRPNSVDALMSRGAMLLSAGDPGGALNDFAAVIRLDPGQIEAYFNRGIAHFDLGYWSEAAADFSVVIQREPGDAGAYLNRAQSLAAAGQDAARSDYDRAVDLAPEWAQAWFARGVFYESRGDREAANRDFMRAYELGYEDPWLNERVREISG